MHIDIGEVKEVCDNTLGKLDADARALLRVNAGERPNFVGEYDLFARQPQCTRLALNLIAVGQKTLAR